MPNVNELPVNELDRFDEFLSEVVRAGGAAESADANLDPRLAETVREVVSLAGRPSPSTAFAHQLWEDLMRQSDFAAAAALNPNVVTHATARSSSRPWQTWLPLLPSRGRTTRWAQVQFATALLLLITAIAIYVAFLRPQEPTTHGITTNGTAIPAPSTPAGVPMFGADPARTRLMPGPGPEGTPVVRWKFPTIQGIYGSPSVVDDIAYVGRGFVLTSPQHALGSVFAIDAKTGRQLWEFETEGSVLNTPVVSNRTVYVGDFDGNFYAIDGATGSELWKITLGGTANEAAIVDGVIYVATSTGFGNASAVAVADGTVFVGSSPFGSKSTTGLYALNAATGKELWKSTEFESDHSAYYAFDTTSGTRLWEYSIGGALLLCPAVSDGLVVVGDAQNGIYYALDIASGTQKWQVELVGDEIWDLTGPAIANGVVFASTKNGDFLTLDLKTGEQKWRTHLETDYIAASPVVVDNTVYVTAMSGEVFALDAGDGTLNWQFMIPGAEQMHSSPAVLNGVVFVADYESNSAGALYALGDAPAATPSDTTSP